MKRHCWPCVRCVFASLTLWDIVVHEFKKHGLGAMPKEKRSRDKTTR